MESWRWCLITVVVMIVLPCHCRGPHHPRGDSIKHQHVHYRPTKEQKITQDEHLLHDKDHLEEHLAEVVNEPNLANMTDEEMEFYYFQVHDTDNNSKLDGLEILHAISHTDHHVHDDGIQHEEETDLEQYIELIDRVLREDDVDNDGFLSYPEYVAGRKKDNDHQDNNDISSDQVQPNVQII